MRAITVTRSTTASRVFAVVGVVIVAWLALMPVWGEISTERKTVELLMLIALAQMWNLLAGYAGLVSVGQQAFVGLGAYGVVVFANVHGLNMYLAVPLAAVSAAILSIPMALIAFRLRGSYFAIATWVLAEVVRLIMLKTESVGAGNGVSIKVTGDKDLRQHIILWLALGVGVGAILVAYGVLRSRLGLQLQAIRDNEAGASGLGTNNYRARMIIWVTAALWTGLAGATFHLQQLRVQPSGVGGVFSVVQWTAPIIFIVVVGGFGTIEGPVIGAILYWYFKDRFTNSVNWYFLTLGAVAMILALWLQPGVWGAIRRWLKIDLFPVRRRLTVTDDPVPPTPA
jgi:branched-chain amino acid transport system permease protein